MRTDNQPRLQTPVLDPSIPKPDTGETTNLVSPTTQQVFSTSHLPGSNAAPTTTAQASSTVRVEAHKGIGIFDRSVFSKPFAQAHSAALQAIKNPANQAYMSKNGHFLPEATIAVDKFMTLVSTKSAFNPAASAARNAFAEGPLTEIEKHAWFQFIEQIPPSYTQEFGMTSTWKNVETEELKTALKSDAGFAQFIHKPEGEKFINELKYAINSKKSDMLGTDKGMALVFRFDSAYSAVAHTALASLWRDATGKLCMGVAHQESVPPSDAKTDVPRGVVYDTFDTSSTFPGGHAPVVESMKLAGLPSVNVFPCPQPEAIQQAVLEIAGEKNANPYGATDNWRNNNRGKFSADRPFETCFNVTHKVLAQLYGVETSQAPLLPNVLVAMRPFVSIPEDQFNTVAIPNGKDAKSIELKQVAAQPSEDIVKTFMAIGEQWGLSGAWDVRGQSRTSKHSVALSPGQRGIALPSGSRNFKFISDPAMLTLNGKPVKAGISYSNEDAAEMIYQGKEKSRPLLFVAAIPERAKL